VIAGLREWRCHLEGRPVVIETDHQPNTYLDELPPSAHSLKRRARWLAESGGFDYTWKYRPGATNVADPVSRAPQHLRLCVVKRSKSCKQADADLQDPETAEHNLLDIPRAAGVSDAVLEQVGCFVMKGLVSRLKEGYANARSDPKQKMNLNPSKPTPRVCFGRLMTSYGCPTMKIYGLIALKPCTLTRMPATMASAAPTICCPGLFIGRGCFPQFKRSSDVVTLVNGSRPRDTANMANCTPYRCQNAVGNQSHWT
jgi:hypothetical protein